jgi:phospholipase C
MMIGAAGVAALTMCVATPASRRAVPPAAAATAAPYGKIKHVVVMYQENRSFDEVLGSWCMQTKRCDGRVGAVRLKDGSAALMTQSPDVVSQDPPHDVNTQERAIDGGKMDGWGGLSPTCHSPGNNICLTYYTASQIPSLTALANSYVVSDRTFSAQNSPSWGGHMWAAASTQDGFTGDTPNPAQGTSWGCDANATAAWVSPSGQTSQQPSCVPAPAGFLDPAKYPFRGAFKATTVPNVPTIFDRLDAAHRNWKIYSRVYTWSVCPTFAKCLYSSQHTNVVPTEQILTDAKNGTLPAYSVLLPNAPGKATGQHPPASMLIGDNWIGQVAYALQASPQWSSTAFIITYDDCGCFYDHVAPGVNPDGTKQGIREPTVIISPYAKRGTTDHTTATFASILRFTEEAFGLTALGVNDAKAYDYANAFDFTQAASAPRVWPRQQPIPNSTTRALSANPPSDDEDDPT